MWVPVAVRRVANCYTPFTLLLLYIDHRQRRASVRMLKYATKSAHFCGGSSPLHLTYNSFDHRNIIPLITGVHAQTASRSVHPLLHCRTHQCIQQTQTMEPVTINHILCYNYTGWSDVTESIILFVLLISLICYPSVLWRCWLGGKKGIRTVKKQSGGVLAW